MSRPTRDMENSSSLAETDACDLCKRGIKLLDIYDRIIFRKKIDEPLALNLGTPLRKNDKEGV